MLKQNTKIVWATKGLWCPFLNKIALAFCVYSLWFYEGCELSHFWDIPHTENISPTAHPPNTHLCRYNKFSSFSKFTFIYWFLIIRPKTYINSCDLFEKKKKNLKHNVIYIGTWEAIEKPVAIIHQLLRFPYTQTVLFSSDSLTHLLHSSLSLFFTRIS